HRVEEVRAGGGRGRHVLVPERPRRELREVRGLPPRLQADDLLRVPAQDQVDLPFEGLEEPVRVRGAGGPCDCDDGPHRGRGAVPRKVYILGPLGTSRLSAEFGGARDDGSAPYHPRKGSRNIVRTALQQLEEAGYVGIREKRGRILTPSGRKLVDRFAYDILIEMAKVDPQMLKYGRVK